MPLVFHVGETNDVRDGFTFGIFTLVFLALVNAGNAECMNFLGYRLFKLALDPDKGLVFIAELLVQLDDRHFKQFGQRCKLCRAGLHIFGYGPYAGGRHARSKNQPVAIQDAATVGG